MERFRRASSLPDQLKIATGKRPSIGRAAESFSSKWFGPFRSSRRKDELAAQRSSPFLKALFRLPNELHTAILSELSISDLLAIRITSRVLNNLVTTCGSPIVRHWVKNRLGNLHIKLYPPPGTNEAELHYLLAIRRRHIASIRLTQELANYVLKDTLKHTNERQRQLWTSVYEKLIPLVFAVGYFLEEHRRVILERDLGRRWAQSRIGFDICTTPGITEQERAIFMRLDQPLRLQYFYMYCFIVQVLSRKLRPPTYAGQFERIARGWTRKPACNEDIAFVLILGGISQVAKLLACKNYSDRRRLLHTFITRLSPHESVAWRAHWRDLGVSSPALLDDLPCSSIGITQLDQIWEPLIQEMMRPESREFTDSQKSQYHEIRSSRKYINELMGYDILRGRPAEGHDDEDDDDDDDELYA